MQMESGQNCDYGVLELLPPRRAYQNQIIDLQERLTKLSEKPLSELIKQTIEINKLYGHSGFLNQETRESANQNPEQHQQALKIDSQGEVLHQKVVERALNLMNTLKGQNEGKLPKMVLEQIHGKPDCESSHVNISISGFLSEQCNKEKKWKSIKKHFQCGQPDILGHSTAAFALTWESKTNGDLYKIIGETLAQMAVNGAIQYATGPIGRVGMLVLASNGLANVN